MNHYALGLLLFLGLCSCNPGNKTIPTGKTQLSFELDKVLSEQYNSSFPGCAVLVSRRGKIIYKNSFGLAEVDKKVPVSTETLFEAGSITGQFTAIAIMQLVEKGEISLNDPIISIFGGVPDGGKSVTIENLLTHTSGIKDSVDAIIAESKTELKSNLPDKLVSLLKSGNLNFYPGTRWNYTVSDYQLLGLVIEKVTGKTYEQYIEDNILKPAGIKNSFYANDLKTTSSLATGYKRVDNRYLKTDFSGNSSASAANGLYLSVEDLYNLYSALNSEKILKKEGLGLIRRGFRLSNGEDTSYGYGVELNYGSRSTIPIFTVRQTSAFNGYFTKMIYAPYEDVLIALFSNCENYSAADPTQTIFNKVLTDVYGSLGFKDKDSSRFVFYHFLMSVKVLPYGGILERGQKAVVYINGDTKNLHYTTDGSEPTINSPSYEKEILLVNSCSLKTKIIPSASSDTLKSVSYSFVEGVSPEPVKDISGMKPGLKYSYYEGGWNLLPDFSKLTPKVSGITGVPDLSVALKKDSCALQFDGFVNIPAKGMYYIYSISDDGSKVFLNDQLIVNSDGSHGTVPEAYLLPLKEGYYPIRIQYFENSGGQELNIGYWRDGSEPTSFKKEAFFYRE
jgi:CubicO group peptidase (beta-lactamase class C family)